LQTDTQTTVTMLCLAGLHVLDKKYFFKCWQNKKKRLKRKKRDKNLKKCKKRIFTLMVY